MRKPPIELRDGDEVRPEYDFSKLKSVGRGIYAERYRAGVKFSLLIDEELLKEKDFKEENVDEPRNISKQVKTASLLLE